MLTQVSDEIRKYLRIYTDFEQLELDVDKWDERGQRELYYDNDKVLELEECDDLVALLHKIQDGVKFFKAHLNDFLKADVYLRRYENLRERLTTMVSNLILKTIKEALQKINLKLTNYQ